MQEQNAGKIFLAIIFVFVIIVLSVVIIPKITGNHWLDSDDKFVFEGLSGPVNDSHLIKRTPSRWQRYEKGSYSRLAILLTEDKSSAWLGLVHGFKTMGIPFRITNDVDEALKHNVVFAYPTISGKVLNTVELKKLAGFARTGGTLIATNVVGGGMNPIFGFDSVKSSQGNYQLELLNNHPLTKEFDNEELRTIRFSTKESSELDFGTYSYSNSKHAPLAVYNDGEAAIVYNKFKNSEAYALGFDLGFYLLKAYNRRLGNVAKTYANHYESSVDNILRLLKNIYQRSEPHAVTLGTVPFAHSLSVILTHDIDYNRSLKNALTYAKHEDENNVSATHFVQTKYIRDWNDMMFFDDNAATNLNKLNSFNVEIASHSVSHSLVFDEFLIGDGKEKYPDYSPFVRDSKTTYNGTILGELSVSKFLLESLVEDSKIVSFRPGHLVNPLALPESLQSTGYRYSSSVTANVSLTHLPFKLNYNRDIETEVDVFEFPITVEDELPPRMGDRIDQAINLAHKIRRYGGIFVVLIHPNILGHKLKFQTEFVNAMKPYAWFGSLREFGDWWSIRDKIGIDVKKIKKNKIVTLNIPEKINGLVVNVPETWTLSKVMPKDIKVSKKKSVVVLGEVNGKVELVFN